MSIITAVQNASSEVEISSPSAESTAVHRVFAELRNYANYKIVLAQVAVISPVRRSGDAQFNAIHCVEVQTASAGDALQYRAAEVSFDSPSIGDSIQTSGGRLGEGNN